MKTNKICVECGSDDLRPMEPDYPTLTECGNCRHPNDLDTDSTEESQLKKEEDMCDISSNLDATINSVDSELDWSILNQPFSIDRMDAILNEPDNSDTEAQQYEEKQYFPDEY